MRQIGWNLECCCGFNRTVERKLFAELKRGVEQGKSSFQVIFRVNQITLRENVVFLELPNVDGIKLLIDSIASPRRSTRQRKQFVPFDAAKKEYQ